MFQDINVTKSTPFALLTIYQKSLYPPKVFKIAPNFGKLREIRRPFFIWTTGNGNLKYHSKIARNSLNSPTTTANDAKST